jgi:hypothetical protein
MRVMACAALTKKEAQSAFRAKGRIVDRATEPIPRTEGQAPHRPRRPKAEKIAAAQRGAVRAPMERFLTRGMGRERREGAQIGRRQDGRAGERERDPRRHPRRAFVSGAMCKEKVSLWILLDRTFGDPDIGGSAQTREIDVPDFCRHPAAGPGTSLRRLSRRSGSPRRLSLSDARNDPVPGPTPVCRGRAQDRRVGLTWRSCICGRRRGTIRCGV